ncbi:MAG: polysaccharide biosynthesis/export family protein [Desulfobaccales bacterium]
MTGKKFISITLCLFILIPPTQGWGQKYEDQAQFYLQQIGPGQASRSAPQSPTRTELPSQAATPAPPAQVLTTAPRQPEEISNVERRAWANRMFLKQFGYSFFYQPPASFLPVQAVPVGPDYIIGPGDSIKIIIWGSVQGEYNLSVNRNGQVDIPKVGVVQVSGLTFGQLRQVLDREFARQYNNFQMNVTLDNLRTIQVFIVGQARFPGSYAVSSLSTLVNALFAAGGPSKSGSMRNIQVRRGGKVITTFDMYDFFLRGDKSKDIRLQSEDVIFIPPIGPMAAIGTPKSLKEVGEALQTVARVQLQRKAEEIPGGSSSPSSPEMTQASPQGWQLQENLKIISPYKKELKPGEIKPAPQSWLELETGQKETEFEKRFGISLPEAVNKLAMSNGLDFGGPIKVQGIYELKNEKSLSDLLRLAGGLGDTAFKGRVQVLRVQGRQAMILFDEDLGKVESRQHDFRLVDGDFVEIFPVPSQVEKKLVIAGAVKNPGEFGYRDNLRVSDLVAYAGGLLQQADKSQAEITRVTITPQGPETTRLNIRLFGALSNVLRDNVVLKPNDYLFIRTVPDWDIYKTVEIAGEVKSPGTYAIKKGETLSSALARTGGFTDRAYLLGAVLLRESTKEIQKQQLKAAIDRLEAQSMATAGEKASTGVEAEEAKRVEVIAKQQQALIASLRKVEPLGRVVINVSDPERLRGTPDDIALQEGDRVMIPQAQGTVNVVGAVFAPTAIVHAPYRTVKDYLTMAGGTTEIADEKEIYVIKVNGGAVSRKGFSWLGAGWDGTKYAYHPGGLKSMALDPGDTIVVPERLERIAWLKEIKDIATILGNIALTAGVVMVGLRR